MKAILTYVNVQRRSQVCLHEMCDTSLRWLE